MLRTSYLSRDDPLKHVRVDDDGTIHIDALNAAKHIRLRVKSKDLAGNLAGSAVKIEFKQSPGTLDLPFDPPSGSVGTRVYSGLSANWDAVKAFVKDITQLDLEDPVEVEDSWAFVRTQRRPLFTDSLFMNANSVRISFDPSKGEIISEAWFSEQQWNTVEAVSTQVKTEMGLFQFSSVEDGVYSLNGRVRVLGEDVISKPVMMHWYAKHVPASSPGTSFNSSIAKAELIEPYGLHPVLRYELSGSPPLAPFCSLYTLLELPSDVFLDQYELDDAPESGELLAVWGNTDLERAHWDHTQMSAALFKLPHDAAGNFTVPLHFRYAAPSVNREQFGELPSPHVFYTCRNDIAPERDVAYINPSERMGVESFFPLENSIFYELTPANTIPYRIPAINPLFNYNASVTTLWIVASQALLLATMVLIHGISKMKMKRKEKQD